jgi:hypothetical protein
MRSAIFESSEDIIAYRSQPDSIDVWRQRRSQNEPIEILLSASAYDTATIAFKPFPATSLIDTKILPVDIWID